MIKTIKDKGRKFGPVILALMLALWMLPAVAMADPPANTAEISAGAPLEGVTADSLVPGEVFTVPITITDNPGFATAVIAVHFDPSVLEYVPGSLDNSSPSIFGDSGWLMTPNDTTEVDSGALYDGALYLPSASNADDLCFDNGNLFTVQFKVKDSVAVGTTTSIDVGLRLDAPGNFSRPQAAGPAIPVAVNFHSLDITVASTPPTVVPAQVAVGDVSDPVAPGDTFTVPVTVTDNPGFNTAALTLSYDSSALTLNSFDTTGGLFAGGMFFTDIPSSSFTFASLGAITQDGVLCYANFTVDSSAADGSYPISIGLKDDHDLNFGDGSGAVPVEFTAGSVTVQAPVVVTPAQVAVGDAPATVLPGDTFTVPVTITDNPGFASAAFSLSYDSDALTFDSFDTTGTLFAAPSFLQDLASSSFTHMGSSNITQDGVLIYATFTVKAGAAAGSYPISVGLKDGNELNFLNASLATVPAEFTSGSVTVGEPVVGPTDTTIVVGSAQANQGATVTVPVSVEANAGFASGTFKIGYDSSVLELTNIVPSDQLLNGLFSFYLASPLTNMMLIANETDITSDVELFDLVFKVKDDAAAGDTQVNVSLQDDNGDVSHFFNNAACASVPVAFEPGTITVNAQHEMNIPDDLTMPAFDSGTTWTRVYNGNPQPVSIGLSVGGGTGAVTVYYDGLTTAPTNVGSYEVSVTVDGVAGYLPVTTPVTVGTLEIVKAPAPTITWPTASSITYGQALSDVVLSPLTNEYGSFAWSSSVDLSAKPDAGTYEYQVVFTPNANTLQNYEPIAQLTQDVQVVVNKAAAPVITDWPTAKTMRQGQTLSSDLLSFTTNEYGTFDWTDTSIAPLWPGGDYEVTFTPSAAISKNYQPIAVTTQMVHVKVVIPGDTTDSGYVSSLDVMRILQQAAGLINLQGDALLAADVDGNGYVEAADAVLAARIVVGLA